VLAPEVKRQVGFLCDQFQAARPFRHLVIDDFLDPDYCRQLIAEFPPFDEKQAVNELGEVGRKAVCQNLSHLGPAYARFDAMLRDKEFRSFLGEITAIPDLLYDREYAGGGTHENLSGQDLDPHVDFNYHPSTGFHRRLNLILFLNPEWQEDWGGLLELHRNPWLPSEENEIKTILPIQNRCVIFETTERSWHGFRRIQLPEDKAKLSRRSIAVYFYTRERPPREAAPSHGTIYVPRPLPEQIQPGHTLGEDDVFELRTLLAPLLARRDRQIQFLYDREIQFSRILQSRTFRLVRFLRKLVRTFAF
jgi:Rps23 Pro-64 3,4-dihydroxylase Tpa1-like proline 4-hydroxylase